MSTDFPYGPIYAQGRRRLALRSQFNVLHALFLREAEMRHGKSYPLSYIVAGIEPLIIVGTIALLFSLMSKTPAYGSSLLLFIGTGVFPIYLFIHTSMRLRQPLNANIQRLRYPIEQPLDYMVIHAALHGFSSFVVAMLFFLALYYFGGVNEALPCNLVAAIEALAAIITLGIAMGILNSVIGRFVPVWDALWPGLARASLHFSGPYFVAAYLPPDTRWWFGLNPIIHGVNWFRHGFYPFYPNQLTDHWYLIGFAISMLALGLMLEVATRRTLMDKD